LQEIKTIKLPIELGIFQVSDVNCYLIKTAVGYILIDTGISNKRSELEKELESAGCLPGNLKLIVLTHGDFDHTGNAAYLREKYKTPIAMHSSDLRMVEYGDMSWNRKANSVLSTAFRYAPLIFSAFLFFSKSSKLERFKPDFTVDEGYIFSEYGFDAKVVHIPGHSMGSIGILTSDDDLFCGDLFVNRGKPILNRLMDDMAAAKASVKKLKTLKINTLYPAHGKPFPMEPFRN
jgi:glyoxylase-like metal-dependent hydrolase (beta-lactamase superfamily II)